MASSSEDWAFKARDRRWTEARLQDRKWEGPFFFLQLADTQLGLLNNNGEDMDTEIAMARLALQHINRLRPKFAIVCGDMVNAFPDEGSGEREQQDRQIDVFKSIFRGSTVPLVCLCGNHDVGNEPTAQTIDRYVSHFGDDYFTFWSGGVKCIVVNSSLYKDARRCPDLLAAQSAWLERELDPKTLHEEQPKHVLLFSHIPPFIYSPSEPSEYFNLDVKTRQQLLDLAKRAHVPAWFCGHFHRNAGGWDGTLEVVVTSAVGVQLLSGGNALGLPVSLAQPPLGADVSGLRVVKVRETAVEHRWYVLDAVPHSVDPAALEWEQNTLPPRL